MKFVDDVRIYIQSGSGGRGCASFLRAKYNPFGGPDGGNGGCGADVWLVADPSLNTLVDFRYKRIWKGHDGQNGMGKRRTGADAPPVLLKVPYGTKVLDESRENVLAEVSRDNVRSLVLPGGKGGAGNACFKSSTNQRTRQTSDPVEGIGLWVHLQLSLTADVGLVGLPNAGKSSFLRAVSRAKPKVASFPFTTLHPNLGVVVRNYQELIFEDIPGLIDGASQGKGLGHRFLCHAEKCKVLMHLVSLESEHPYEDYLTVRKEIEAYNEELAKKEHLILLTKKDLFLDEEVEKIKAFFQKEKTPVYVCSSFSNEGIEDVVRFAFSLNQK